MRQNTPHPRELKAKAHKLFGKGSSHGQTSLEESDQHADGLVNSTSNELGKQLKHHSMFLSAMYIFNIMQEYESYNYRYLKNDAAT